MQVRLWLDHLDKEYGDKVPCGIFEIGDLYKLNLRLEERNGKDDFLNFYNLYVYCILLLY